jgi:hypothetical protein
LTKSFGFARRRYTTVTLSVFSLPYFSQEGV